MKIKHQAIAILLLGLFACTPYGHEKAEQVFKEGYKHLLVMHPTVQNLERMIFLTETGVFPLPDNYRIVGVYHEDANYDYSLSAGFLKRTNPANMALFPIDTPIDPDALFTPNALTQVFEDLFRLSDAAFFLGGPDIPPATYNDEFNLLTVVTDPFRHYLELSFLFHLVGGSQDTTYTALLEENPGFAILGICLGMQTINVASGGSLIQDIPTEVYDVFTVEEVVALDPELQHRNYYSYYRLDPEVSTPSYHRIVLENNSHMAVISGEAGQTPYVLSSHHQAIKDMGMGYKATAWSLDKKIIEAIEHEEYPNVIGIQFHPEVPYLYDPEHKISLRPGEEGSHSFLELYPGPEGADFHHAFWVHIAAMLP